MVMQGVESVLLYYKYVDLTGRQTEVQSWYLKLCTELRLVGRIRVAEDGINVTVGGLHSSLQEHIKAVKSHAVLGSDIDFKLAKSEGPESALAVRESHFDTLQVLLCKEVVSLGSKVAFDPQQLFHQTATHLSPQEWHSHLQNESQDMNRPTVLLDARNIYETRIGHFASDTANFLDPHLRQFSDLPDWIVENADHLRRRKILMYCTGGVRCERASAFLKSLGPDFQEVYQLQGGIQRYIEQFPQGGFFRGRNFVFDERVSVAPAESSGKEAVGSCLVCDLACSSYKPRLRCSACRMLVLVCCSCASKAAHRHLDCELCMARRSQSCAPQLPPSKKLRILCLHGFRQSGAILEAKIAKFVAETADVAEYTFLDAPHTLPFLYRPKPLGESKPLPEVDGSRPKRAWMLEPCQTNIAPGEKGAWKIAPEEIFADQFKRQTEGWSISWSCIQETLLQKGPFDGLLGFSQGAAAAAMACAKLQQESVTTSQAVDHQTQERLDKLADADCVQPQAYPHPSESNGVHPAHQAAPNLVNDSLSGPTLESTSCAGDRTAAEHVGQYAVGSEDETNVVQGHGKFEFAILCSGFVPRIGEAAALQRQVDYIDLPSLHIFAQEDRRKHREIPVEESQALQRLFHKDKSTALRIARGHALPADKQSVASYRAFLKQFV